MFCRSVRAAGVAALFAACALLGHAGEWHSWSPKKSQRETLHPSDCQFGYFGTNWRVWPEGCDRGIGCADRYAPTKWPPSMTPLPAQPASSWPIPPQSDSQNPWPPLPADLQMSPAIEGPLLPRPTYGPPSYTPVPSLNPPTPLPPLESVPPAAQPIPAPPAPVGQRVPVPPMPTTKVAPSRGVTPAVVPTGGWNRSVPATLSAPDFGPSAIQPLSHSAPQRKIETSPRNKGPVMLLPPEF